MVPATNADPVIKRQTQVSSHFFRGAKIDEKDWKGKRACRKAMDAFTQSRTQGGSSPIVVHKMSLRAVVIADATCTQCKSQKFQSVYTTSYWTPKGDRMVLWSPEETVQILTPRGTHSHMLTSVQKTTAHSNHPGDCRLDFAHEQKVGQKQPSYINDHKVGSYDWILTQIEKIGSTMKEQKAIASLLLDHGTVAKTISFSRIQRKLEIADWTDVHEANFNAMYSLLVEESNFKTLESILKQVAKGQSTFLEAIDKESKAHLKGKKFVGPFADLFMSFITEESPDKERVLSSLLLRLALPTRRFEPITKQDLRDNLIPDSLENIQFLNDLYGLLFIKEITRRLNPQNSAVDLPYAPCLIRGLKLVGKKSINLAGVEKILGFRDIFDPKNGLLFFTRASFLQKDNTGPSKELIKKLNASYAIAFPDEAKAEEFNTPRAMMGELSRHFGGASDSDEDSYAAF